MSNAEWGPEDEKMAVIAVLVLVVVLLIMRSCLPMGYYSSAERPATPPESLYQPGG